MHDSAGGLSSEVLSSGAPLVFSPTFWAKCAYCAIELTRGQEIVIHRFLSHATLFSRENDTVC